MKRNNKILWIVAAVLLVLFVAFTFAVTRVDVQADSEKTTVGFAGINIAVRDAVGLNMTLYEITNLLGYAAIAGGLCFVLAGLVQAVARKSLFKVDRWLVCLVAVYVLLAAVYLLFEKVIVNYRPFIVDAAEGLEASYPSSHTLLGVTIAGTALVALGRLLRKKPALRTLAVLGCLAVMAAMAVGRALSGAHWITDIFASLLLSAALITGYAAASAPAAEQGAHDRADGEE